MPKTENPADTVEFVRYSGRVLFDELTEIVDPEPHSAALNMAIDEVLLARVTAPALRIYRWSIPAVSFGYFGRHAEVAAQWPERDAVRRWTGGGVVLHGEDITYSLFIPKQHALGAGKALDSYRAIHECVAEWLKAAGMEVSLAAGAPKQSEECFANPAPHDVLAGEKKVSGSAQRRTKWGLLHQGSIQPAGAAIQERRPFLARAFARRVARRELLEEEWSAAAALLREKYGTLRWNERW